MRLNCPDCGSTFNLLQAMEDADGRRFVELLTSLPPVVVRPLVRYLRLFKPFKQGLRWSRMLKLTRELEPMIRAAQVERNGAVYVVPASVWAATMAALVDTPPKTLSLPLSSNGYLLSILAGEAEKQAAQDEQHREVARRSRGRDGTSGAPLQVGELLKKEKSEKRSSPPPGWKDKVFQRGDDNHD